MLGFRPLAAGPLASGPISITSVSTLSGSSALIASATVVTMQYGAILSSAASLSGSLLLQSQVTTSLSGNAALAAALALISLNTANLIGNATFGGDAAINLRIGHSAAILSGVSNLIASSTVNTLFRVQLPGTASLIATPTQKASITARLPGNAALFGGLLLRTSHVTANLISSESLFVATATLLSPLTTVFGGIGAMFGDISLNELLKNITVVMNGASALIADLTPFVRPGGSSYFTGPTAEMLDYPLEQPTPSRPIKRRKQVKKPKLPPEVAIPVIIPLPPKNLSEPPKPIVIYSKPVRPHATAVEAQAMPLSHSITNAQDESSDIEDAMMVLKHIGLI